MKSQKTLSEWFTHRYLLIIRDEETYQEVQSSRFNYAKVTVLVTAVFIVLLALALGVSSLFNKLKGGNTLSNKNKMLLLAIKVDSLERDISIKENYYTNLKKILTDDIQIVEEQVSDEEDTNQKPSDNQNLEQIDVVDSEFRKEFEDSDSDLNIVDNLKEELQHIVFFTPLVGVKNKGFDAKKNHIGIDLAARKNEAIKATLDGTVIIASWTQDSGYVIGIQHKNQLISFYKHNSVLLKEVGEYVKTGEPIAIIGNSGEYTDGQHLHFELWYNGNPINPEKFVQF